MFSMPWKDMEMLDPDKMKLYYFAEWGKFFPSGQALPIPTSPEAGQNSRQYSRKEAHVY